MATQTRCVVPGAVGAVLLLLSACVLPEVGTRDASVARRGSEVTPQESQAPSQGVSAPAPSMSVEMNSSCSGCAPGAYCIPRVGVPALCLCPRGQVGNGLSCAPDAACAAVGCGEYALCVQAKEGLDCQCVQGWNGDGHTCEDLDECMTQPSPCGKNATCQNLIGSYRCTCREGYEDKKGDGKTCVSKDTGPCAAMSCDIHASCQNGSCVCDSGYKGDGTSCVAVPRCGNGVRESIEQCDGQDLGDATCRQLGFTGGTLGCLPGCGFDTHGCTGGAAGSGGAAGR